MNPFKPQLRMLTGAESTQIENRIRPEGPRKVTGWRLVGASYKRGHRIAGATILELEGGGIVYFPESVSLAEAIDRAQVERGYDVRDVRARVDEWIRTGKGASFTLED